MSNEGSVGGALFVIFMWIGAGVGWGLNIYKLWGLETLDVKAILRIVGIFVGPLGAVLGYIP